MSKSFLNHRANRCCWPKPSPMKFLLTNASLILMLLVQSPLMADPDDRQDRRQERGRSVERQDKRDCRQDEPSRLAGPGQLQLEVNAFRQAHGIYEKF